MRTGLIVVAGCVVLTLASTLRVEAACNVIPFETTRPTQGDGYFHGTRGRLSSPFVIPTDNLEITRRICDGGADFAHTNPDSVRTIVVVRNRAQGGTPRALVLKRGTGDCTGDAFTQECAKALGHASRATCFNVPAKNYEIAEKTIRVSFPDPNPAETPGRDTGGRATVAVVHDTEKGDICAALARAQPGRCDEAVEDAEAFRTLAACIDDIREPAAADTCPTNQDPQHPTFAEPTLLPVPNDIYELCADGSGKLCEGSPRDEARYALDVGGNALVPVYWERGLEKCGSKCRKLSLVAEMRQPRPMDLSPNDDYLARNIWLQSFTYAGGQLHPPFMLAPPSNANDPTLRAFAGTADENVSVLRFSSYFGECKNVAGKRCNSKLDCDGEACLPRCRNDFSDCADGTCPAGLCAANFDLKSESFNGSWQLDRTTNVFCHQNPGQPCTADSDACECVSFIVTMKGCDCTDPKPDITISPQASPALVSTSTVVAAPLVGALGVPDKKVVAREASSDVQAVIVPRRALGSSAPESCRKRDADLVLAVARQEGCATTSGCSLSCPDLGPSALVPRLGVAGSQVRFLQLTAAARPNLRWWERFWYWLTGRQSVSAATTETATLRLIDHRASTPRVVTVADVVTGNADYDPLAPTTSGGSSFLIKAGRCETADGRTLGIPSLCFPAEPGVCPGWTTCKPGVVAIATDLALDADADGVPDLIDPSVQAALRRR